MALGVHRHARHLAKIQTFWKLRIVRHRIERNLGSALLGESWSSKQYQNCGQESFHSNLPGSFGLSQLDHTSSPPVRATALALRTRVRGAEHRGTGALTSA